MADEKRLVYAQEVKEIFDHEVYMGETDLFDAFDTAIDSATTVDAVKVAHGSWAFIAEDCCVCSVCHKHSIVDYHYCPECGAKMDGVQIE